MWRRLLAASLLPVLLAACGGSQTRSVATATSEGVTIRLAVDPAVVGERNELSVRLENSAGKPLTGAHVTVALDMPAMPMRRSPLVLSEEGGGAYVNVNPDFDMGGTWTADVRVTTQDGRRPHGSLQLEIRD